jgi:CBS domain-containing protein
VNATLPSYFGMLQTTSFIPDTNQMKRKLTEIKHEPLTNYINRPVVTVSENDTILHAADLLLRKRIFTLFVVNEEGKLSGYVNRSMILLGVLEDINGGNN